MSEEKPKPTGPEVTNLSPEERGKLEEYSPSNYVLTNSNSEAKSLQDGLAGIRPFLMHRRLIIKPYWSELMASRKNIKNCKRKIKCFKNGSEIPYNEMLRQNHAHKTPMYFLWYIISSNISTIHTINPPSDAYEGGRTLCPSPPSRSPGIGSVTSFLRTHLELA